MRVARAQDAAAPVILCPSVRVPPAAEQKESMQQDGPEGRTQVLSSSTRWKGGAAHLSPAVLARPGGEEGGREAREGSSHTGLGMPLWLKQELLPSLYPFVAYQVYITHLL